MYDPNLRDGVTKALTSLDYFFVEATQVAMDDIAIIDNEEMRAIALYAWRSMMRKYIHITDKGEEFLSAINDVMGPS